MQHVQPLDFSALSPAQAKKAALAAFEAAVINPHGADWQAVAYGLHSAMTAKRSPKAEQPAADGFLPWYAPAAETYPKRATANPKIDFVFADGVTVSAAAWQRGKNPVNIGLACRVAVSLYRAKTRQEAVPAIVSATYRDTGETWNPDMINAQTAEARAALRLVPVFAPIDPTAAMMRRHAIEARNRVLAIIGDPWAEVSDPDSMAQTFKPVMMREPLAYPCDAETEAALSDPAALAKHESVWRIVPLIASEITHPSQFEVVRPSDAPSAPVEVVEASDAPAPAVEADGVTTSADGVTAWRSAELQQAIEQAAQVEAVEAIPCDAPPPILTRYGEDIEDEPDRHMEAVATIATDHKAETCPVVLGITGRLTLPARSERACQAADAFGDLGAVQVEDAPPSDAPSRASRLRLVALRSTAGVPLVGLVGLRRTVPSRIAA